MFIDRKRHSKSCQVASHPSFTFRLLRYSGPLCSDGKKIHLVEFYFLIKSPLPTLTLNQECNEHYYYPWSLNWIIDSATGAESHRAMCY